MSTRTLKMLIIGSLVLACIVLMYVFLHGKKIELTQNPEYLYSSEFNPANVTLNGIGIGDRVGRINETDISERYDNFGWIHTKSGLSYRYASSTQKIVELRLSGDAMRDLGLMSEREVIPRFGKPDRQETAGFGGKEYFYDNRGLMVSAHNNIGITVNILGI